MTSSHLYFSVLAHDNDLVRPLPPFVLYSHLTANMSHFRKRNAISEPLHFGCHLAIMHMNVQSVEPFRKSDLRSLFRVPRSKHCAPAAGVI